jgi:hypothetical protein
VAGYQSDVRVRKPCLMLIGIEPGDEPAELGLQELAGALRVVRVRHALPACHRMLIVQPVVVIVGESVQEWSLPALDDAARQTGAEVLLLGPLVVREALRDWLRRALEAGLRRRAERERKAAAS